MVVSDFCASFIKSSSVAIAAGLLMSTSAQAQFGGFLQSVIGAAAQQAAQQAAQPAPVAANPYAAQPALAPQLNAAQTNAIASVAASIPVTDPEYQALMAQSLVNIPVAQRSTLAPIIDVQVRQSLAARRLGLAGVPATAAVAQPGVVANPAAQQALQGALMQGLAGNGQGLPTNLGSDAGKAAAAGALIQGLGSLFSRPSTPAAAVPVPPQAPATAP
jgi:hypothetical protein